MKKNCYPFRQSWRREKERRFPWNLGHSELEARTVISGYLIYMKLMSFIFLSPFSHPLPNHPDVFNVSLFLAPVEAHVRGDCLLRVFNYFNGTWSALEQRRKFSSIRTRFLAAFFSRSRPSGSPDLRLSGDEKKERIRKWTSDCPSPCSRLALQGRGWAAVSCLSVSLQFLEMMPCKWCGIIFAVRHAEQPLECQWRPPAFHLTDPVSHALCITCQFQSLSRLSSFWLFLRSASDGHDSSSSNNNRNNHKALNAQTISGSSSATAVVDAATAESSNAPSSGYYGTLIGKLETHHHDAGGEVYAIDESSIFIKGFSYDGTGPDAYFWAGSSSRPDATGFIIPDEKGSWVTIITTLTTSRSLLLHPSSFPFVHPKRCCHSAPPFAPHFIHLVTNQEGTLNSINIAHSITKKAMNMACSQSSK